MTKQADGKPSNINLTLSYYSADSAPDWLRDIAATADKESPKQ